MSGSCHGLPEDTWVQEPSCEDRCTSPSSLPTSSGSCTQSLDANRSLNWLSSSLDVFMGSSDTTTEVVREWGTDWERSVAVAVLVMVYSPSHVWLFVTLWTVAQQAPLSMGFPKQEYWSELPFPSPVDLPDSRIEPASPALAGRFFTTEPPRKLFFTPYPSSNKKQGLSATDRKSILRNPLPSSLSCPEWLHISLLLWAC